MTSLHVIENKSASVQKYLSILDGYRGRSVADIEGDPTLRGAVERYLYLAAQATIDLAEAVIAYRGFRKPVAYRENFEVLVEEGVIPRDLGARLVRMVAFRNVLSHAYDRIDYSVVVETLNHSLTDLAEFVKRVRQSV